MPFMDRVKEIDQVKEKKKQQPIKTYEDLVSDPAQKQELDESLVEGVVPAEPVEQQPEEDKSLKAATEAAEAIGQQKTGDKQPSSWETLRNYIDKKEEDVLKLQKEESQKLMSEEAKRKKSAQLGKIFGDLVNAAALLYAAKKGIQADLKLADPSAAEQIRDIEREMDYKRSLLRDKIALIRKKNYELYGSKVGEQEKKEKEEAATEAAEAKALADQRKAAESQSKEERSRQERIMRQINTDTKNTMKGLLALDGEDLTKELIKYNVPEDMAEELSGEGFLWDDRAKYDEIKNIIRNYHASDWGLVPEQQEQSGEILVKNPKTGEERWMPARREKEFVDKGAEIVGRR